MEIKIGPAVRQIRQKRGYPAKWMYTGLMSRSNYARFEDGGIDTASTNLYELTKRLNISLPEWAMLYNGLNGRDAGKLTAKVNGLLNAGWVAQDPAPLHQAAALCRELFAKYGYPNERLSGLVADALAIYLENGKDIAQPNAALAELVAYLDAMDTWFANDVALLHNILQILDIKTLLRMVTRYLYTVQNNTWLGQGSTSIPAQQELLQQSFATVIAAQDAAAFAQLLDQFNAMPMSERYVFPALMRQVYNAYAAYHRTGEAAALAPVAAVQTVVAAAATPDNADEVRRQVAALDAWFGRP
ncbi:hypothetical protein [Lacticaseibacillus parakribbianus]|uniref:hypothetical protein n=1 Tax=Lacticaseibacillus parakribbianus TaxID=2970927 RepID=UPI0021CB8BA3|nr:hypothetical protein [Lacticaseibacillus parakribbianus]